MKPIHNPNYPSPTRGSHWWSQHNPFSNEQGISNLHVWITQNVGRLEREASVRALNQKFRTKEHYLRNPRILLSIEANYDKEQVCSYNSNKFI